MSTEPSQLCGTNFIPASGTTRKAVQESGEKLFLTAGKEAPSAEGLIRSFIIETDQEGKRVKKVTYDANRQPQETTIFVYSAGKLVAEYSTQTPPTIPPTIPTTNYVATDILQSVRAITNQQGEVTSRRDFMPFGEELYANGTTRTTANKYSTDNQDAVRQRFTGYEKDRETQLDFAEARYYNNSHGRFTAVDPLLASGKSANPQTFNRYVYVGNNPTNITDPFGLDWYKDKNGVRRWSADGKTFDYAADGNYYAEGATRDAVDENWERIVGDDFAYERADGNWVALDPNSTLWKDGFATKEAALGQMRSWYHGGNASALSGEIGMRGPGSMKFLGLLMLSGLSGGAFAAGAVGTAGFWMVAGGEAFMATQAINGVAESERENSLIMGNTSRSLAVSQAEKLINQGGNEVTVNSRSDADALRRNLIEGQGYRNSTGFTGNEVRNNPERFPTGKAGTFHWDYADTQHGGRQHLQIHTHDGRILRIFFNSGGGYAPHTVIPRIPPRR